MSASVSGNGPWVSERVAMTDLAERLIGPDGGAEAQAVAARLAALAEDNRRLIAAGASPEIFARRQALDRALEAARNLIRGIGQWAGSGSPNP